MADVNIRVLQDAQSSFDEAFIDGDAYPLWVGCETLDLMQLLGEPLL